MRTTPATVLEKIATPSDRPSVPPAPAIDWSKAKTGEPIRGKAYLASDAKVRTEFLQSSAPHVAEVALEADESDEAESRDR